MTQRQKLLPKLFAIVMIGIGIFDLSRPESLRQAMDQLDMPHYILWILGFAKILGGTTILVIPSSRLKEWAFAGFFIWALGGLAAHVFSGHGFQEMAPLLGLSFTLVASYFSYRKVSGPQAL